MKSFNFGEISINSNNNPSFEKTPSLDKHSPQELNQTLIDSLSSLYKNKRELISPEIKRELKGLLIAVTISAFSSALGSHLVNKKSESDFDELNPRVSQSLKLKTAENSPLKSQIKLEASSNLTPKHISAEKTPKKISELSLERIKTILDEVHLSAEILTRDEERFPKKLFSKNFLTALKIVESGLNPNAQSDKGAIGETQLMPKTIIEVIRYLNILERKGIIKSGFPPEDEITKEDIEKISTLIKSDKSYSDDFCKLYLMDLLNYFDIGKKDFSLGGVTTARKKILATYNWTPDRFKRNENKEKNWPGQSQRYYKKIFRYMDLLNKIQAQMTKMEMTTDILDLSPILAIEINKYERELNERSPRFDLIIEKIMQDYLITIREMEKIKEKPLETEEVKRLINKFNSEVYRNYKNLTASYKSSK